MKRSLLFLILAVLIFPVNAQNTANPQPVTETLTVKETTYDFGKIQQGRPVTHTFEITNTGTAPLLLTNVQASCGCTTPEWSKEPIQPGATSSIKVGYNAAVEGSFNKTITIQYDNDKTKVLTITGTVYKAPATSAPLNASISLLKS
jgi:Protein of unknown function (DUF1573).